jgi:hypothetical protein
MDLLITAALSIPPMAYTIVLTLICAYAGSSGGAAFFLVATVILFAMGWIA